MSAVDFFISLNNGRSASRHRRSILLRSTARAEIFFETTQATLGPPRSGEVIIAKTGDTLFVSYRSQRAVQAQVWFQEESASPSPQPVPGKDTLSFGLPPASAWSLSPQRMVLDGKWSRQRIWVLWSFQEFTISQARQALDKKAQGIHAQEFRITNTP